MWQELQEWLPAHAGALIRSAAILAIGLSLAQLLGRALRRSLGRRFPMQSAVLASNLAKHLVNAIVLLSVMREFGFKLDALLAAAGVAGVAIGFAAQTGLSNLISGVFMLWERPFRIGDTVEIDGVTGQVQNVGMLATYVRTFDNRLVRFPNETVLKTRVTNVTRFAVRRLDVPIGVGYQEDFDRVAAVLADVARANPLCLDEPRPLVMFTGFGSSALELTLAVWFEKSDLLELRSSLLRDIKARFDREGITIPYPQMTLHASPTERPFVMRLQPPAGDQGACAASHN